MFRTQLYNPLIDPERQEYYNNKSEGYYLTVDHRNIFSPGTKLWHIYKSKLCHIFKSITCRLVMIAYTVYMIYQTYDFFNEILIMFNFIYIILILIDCFIVVHIRKGLEDRWCSLSILYFICANTTCLFLFEIFYNSFLTLNIFHPDTIEHMKQEYSFNNLTIMIDSINEDQNLLNEETYYNELSRHESLFCIILIFSRLFIPQATLTWSALSTICEFSFNTIFDVYTTINMCRDPKLDLPQNIIIACYVVSYGALISISLNMFSEESDTQNKLNISFLRQVSDNIYFRVIIQIVFADLPFLIIRLLIINKYQMLIKPDIYYLITKQYIIITCKILFMIYCWSKNYLKTSN
jgi:hypothetical protein